LRLASADLRSSGAWLSAARSTTARLGRSMAEAAADKGAGGLEEVEWEWGRECRGVFSLGFGLACSAAAASRRLWEERRVRARGLEAKRGKRPRSNRRRWQFSARVCLFNQEAFANTKKWAV
jgi:hypothetical protein